MRTTLASRLFFQPTDFLHFNLRVCKHIPYSHTCMGTHTYTHTYTNTHMHAHIHIHTLTYTNTHTHTSMHIYTQGLESPEGSQSPV